MYWKYGNREYSQLLSRAIVFVAQTKRLPKVKQDVARQTLIRNYINTNSKEQAKSNQYNLRRPNRLPNVIQVAVPPVDESLHHFHNIVCQALC